MALQTPLNKNKINKKKTSATDSRYQSTFLPIFQKAETKIKMLLLTALLLYTSKNELLIKLSAVIKWVDSKIPQDLPNRRAYIEGLKRTIQRYINNFYTPQKAVFERTKKKIEREVEISKPIEKPQQLLDRSKAPNLWAEAKGTPYISNYGKEVKRAMDNLANQPLTTSEKGKKPISLWQKAELDVRYTKQMEMLDKLKNEGVELAFISSHPDCSKRCETWQGELVSLTQEASAPSYTANKKGIHYSKRSFIVDQINGHNVYSLPSIMECVDIYGYNNNIICGFNCRHHLLPFTGQNAPKEYSEKDVAEQRKIEIEIRAKERKIRLLKTQYELYNRSGDYKSAKLLKKQIKALTDYYKAFCESHGYAWEQYRIEI